MGTLAIASNVTAIITPGIIRKIKINMYLEGVRFQTQRYVHIARLKNKSTNLELMLDVRTDTSHIANNVQGKLAEYIHRTIDGKTRHILIPVAEILT